MSEVNEITSYPDPRARHCGDEYWAQVYDDVVKPVIKDTDNIIKGEEGDKKNDN